jgi:transcriptional regulator with XRE-family HTH domain
MEPHEKIRQLRKARGLSQQELGVAVGFDEGQAKQRVSKIELNKVPISTGVLRRFAEALQTTPASILDGETTEGLRNSGGREASVVATDVELGEAIPLVAFSQNGTERRIVGHVERPPSLRGVRHGYAVYAFDDSMEPRYESGWLLYVNPDKPPRPGRDVLVVRQNAPPLVRRLERRSDEVVILRALVDDAGTTVRKAEIATMHLIVGSDQEQ